MKPIILAIVLGIAAAQDPALPDGVKCMAGPPDETQTKMVECHCPVECVVDEYGNKAIVMKNCKAGRCHEKDCLCHTDGNPCQSAQLRADGTCTMHTSAAIEARR